MSYENLSPMLSWLRTRKAAYTLVFLAGIFFSYCVFSGNYSIPFLLGRTSFFLVSVPFLVFGYGLAFLWPIHSYMMIFLGGLYFILILFIYEQLKEALSKNRTAILMGFFVVIWALHSMADRIVSIYIGESIKNTAQAQALAKPDLSKGSFDTPDLNSFVLTGTISQGGE